MGMGYGANCADVIEEEELNNITKGEVGTLSLFLESKDSTLESFAQDIEYDNDELSAEQFVPAQEIYKKIQKTFEEKTGLRLELHYHDKSDSGGRYDEVDGAYWEVYGMYQLSPEGKKMKGKVERRYFVTFG